MNNKNKIQKSQRLLFKKSLKNGNSPREEGLNRKSIFSNSRNARIKKQLTIRDIYNKSNFVVIIIRLLLE